MAELSFEFDWIDPEGAKARNSGQHGPGLRFVWMVGP